MKRSVQLSGALICLMMPLSALAGELTVEVPYELYETPRYGMATLSCTIAKPGCETIATKRKTLKFKGSPPHRGNETFSFSGTEVDHSADVKCEIKAFGDKVVNAKAVSGDVSLQCGEWAQAITMQPMVTDSIRQPGLEAGKFGNWAETDPKAVNINQGYKGTNPKAVNINQGYRGSNPQVLNGATNPQPKTDANGQ